MKERKILEDFDVEHGSGGGSSWGDDSGNSWGFNFSSGCSRDGWGWGCSSGSDRGSGWGSSDDYKGYVKVLEI